MSVKTKICGVRSVEVARELVDSGAEFLGFIFFEKSPRHISLDDYYEVSLDIKEKIKTVVVTVDASNHYLGNILNILKPDYLQLHGTETVERANEIKERYNIPIIKAISVSKKEDLEKAEEFKDVADYILFDAKPPKHSNIPGGNAITFDWGLLKGLKADYKWILSGGIDINNIEEAIKITDAEYIDVSSGVESDKGIKDIEKVNKFLNFVSKL